MKVPEKYYDEIFEFTGLWDVPSKCGLKILKHGEKTYIIATELYQDNPGTSVTYAGYSLFRQICESRGLVEKEVAYLECNPDTNSKLSFYDEEYYHVVFPETDGGSGRPSYGLLSPDEVKFLFS
jgi:hypothetical protein